MQSVKKALITSIMVVSKFYLFAQYTVHINQPEPVNRPQICAVTVSSESDKNLIVWEKNNSERIAEYKIYKRNDTDMQYYPIGIKSVAESGIFIDSSSTPHIKSSYYKISAIDSCGRESELSEAHKTIFLSVENIGNSFLLESEHYVGLPFQNYEIWRGSQADNLFWIGVNPADSIFYTDIYASGGTVFYQLRINLPAPCNPEIAKELTGPFMKSLSNIEEVSNVSYTLSNNRNKSFTIFPNPFSNKTKIVFSNPEAKEYSIVITDITGKQVYLKEKIFSGSVEIEKEFLVPGYYNLILKGETCEYGILIVI